MALLQYLNTVSSRQRYTEESRNGCLLLKSCQEWTYLVPSGTAKILLYSLGEQDYLTLTSQGLSTALKAMHRNQCHHLCFTNIQQRLWNRQSFPQAHQLEINPFPHKIVLSLRQLQISGDQIYLYSFLVGFLCVCLWGCLLCNILQNSSSACHTCVCIQSLLNAVRRDPQRLSRHGKNAALEKCTFRRINKSLSLLICRSSGQREVAVLRSFVSFQNRILCL